MQISIESTLSDLAIRIPAASRIFRAHGLDFCCHGRRPLDQACSERGLDPDEVVAEIEKASPAGDPPATHWLEAPLGELCDFIETRYHAKLREELPALRDLAEKVDLAHIDHAERPRELSALLEGIHEAVFEHLDKEEQVLFPAIRQGIGRGAAGPVQCMEAEHDEHGKNLARLRAMTKDFAPPEDACPTWRALYLRLDELEAELMEHINLENNVLFPRALQDPDLIRTKVNLIPEWVELIRVVDIVGLDRQADGGTHVNSTLEVGSVTVLKTESKGKANKRMRISVDGAA